MFTNYQYFVYFHIKTAEAIFIFYSYCGNDVIACCFISKQHPYLTTPPPACMRDPANWSPASIGTSESDPQPVCGARCLSGARLLSKVLR